MESQSNESFIHSFIHAVLVLIHSMNCFTQPKVDTSLRRDGDGSLGLVIAHEKNFPTPAMFIREVAPNGPAGRCGVLEKGIGR